MELFLIFVLISFLLASWAFLIFITFCLTLFYGKYYYDNSERTGSWSSERFRSFFIWKIIHQLFWFEVKLDGITLEELNDEEGKLFACYPHAVFSTSAVLWATKPKFINKPKYIATSKLALSFPLIRELLLLIGCINAEKEVLINLLVDLKKDILLFPEGVQGMLISSREKLELFIDPKVQLIGNQKQEEQSLALKKRRKVMKKQENESNISTLNKNDEERNTLTLKKEQLNNKEEEERNTPLSKKEEQHQNSSSSYKQEEEETSFSTLKQEILNQHPKSHSSNEQLSKKLKDERNAFHLKQQHDIHEHLGFIKLAYEHDIPLVPVFNQGENKVFRTFQIFNSIRSRMVKRFGYGFPLFFVGPFPTKIVSHIGPKIKKLENESFVEFQSRFFVELFKMIKEHETLPLGSKVSERMKQLFSIETI